MTAGEKMIAELERWGSFDQPKRLDVEAEGYRLELELQAADKFGVELGGIRLQPELPADWQPDALRAWGHRISERIRYLLEPIEASELDTGKGQLLLRSSPPEKRNRDRRYYELLLEKTGRASLQRYRYSAKEGSRASEPIRCTPEQLEKLVDDLVDTAP